MSLVFLASSFEEFVREEIKQCVVELSVKYHGFTAEKRQAVRNLYWASSLTRLNSIKSILTREKPQVVDAMVIARLRALVDCTKGLVLDDDPAHLDASTIVHHSNNFKAHVVDELSRRIGMQSLIDSASESSRLKAYFGTSTKAETSKRLRVKLNEFYDRRNEIVHSLSAAAGYAVDAVLDYFEFFELFADSIKASLGRVVATW
jgi:archaellum biogenesis ATPase FlaH